MRERKSLNKPLLRKLALKLRRLRHEEHYDQGKWINQTKCGTAACIAGWTVLESGLKPAPPEDKWKIGLLRVESCLIGTKKFLIETTAAKLLGLKEHESDVLFSDDPSYMWPAAFGDRWAAAQETQSERPSRIAADLLDALADGKVTL